MHREVFNHMEDCGEHRRRDALDFAPLGKCRSIDPGEDGICVLESPGKRAADGIQLAPLIGPGSGGELTLAFPDVGCTTDAVDDPLTHIACEVEQKIRDRVLVGMRTPPGIVGSEASERRVDLGRILVDQEPTRLAQEGVARGSQAPRRFVFRLGFRP